MVKKQTAVAPFFERVHEKEAITMLSGEFRHSVDAKNRLFIPAKHRDELCVSIPEADVSSDEKTADEKSKCFMITKSIREKCLKVYSMAAWEDYISPILKLERKDSEKILRSLHKDAAQVSPDSQGRIVLTPVLMQYAQIEKSVVIVGCGTCAEIWSERLYDEMNAEEDMEDIRNTLEAYGL